jgi:hypothetical protein
MAKATAELGVRPITMHSIIIDRFPRLGMLWSRSKTTNPDNYFAIYNSATLLPCTEKQFFDWESLLQSLDEESFKIFLAKAAGLVTARTHEERGWTQFIECINEVRGYRYAQSLGYTDVRLIREQSDPLPDLEASKTNEKCLLEVKTIHKSDLDIQLRGQVQVEESGLPLRLERLLRKRYSKAIKQIEGHPWVSEARQICYMVINLDLRTVLAQENERFLEQFLKEIETSVEIHSISQHWPARMNLA